MQHPPGLPGPDPPFPDRTGIRTQRTGRVFFGLPWRSWYPASMVPEPGFFRRLPVSFAALHVHVQVMGVHDPADDAPMNSLPAATSSTLYFFFSMT